MLMPKRSKYRKTHRGESRGKAHSGTTVAFGEYGLQALETIWMDSRQIEAARRAIVGYTKRGGKVWIRIFPDKQMTAKPAETRMGSGKGAPDHWVAVVKEGRMLFEIADVPEAEARESLRLAGHKLPIRTKVVSRAESGNDTAFDRRFLGSKVRGAGRRPGEEGEAGDSDASEQSETTEATDNA